MTHFPEAPRSAPRKSSTRVYVVAYRSSFDFRNGCTPEPVEVFASYHLGVAESFCERLARIMWPLIYKRDSLYPGDWRGAMEKIRNELGWEGLLSLTPIDMEPGHPGPLPTPPTNR